MTNPLHLIGKLIPDDSDIGDLFRRPFSIIVIALVAGGLISVVVFASALWGEYQTRIGAAMVVPQASAGRVEYYRGVFDVCLANVPDKDWCVGLVQFAIDKDWHGTFSEGWNESEYDLK